MLKIVTITDRRMIIGNHVGPFTLNSKPHHHSTTLNLKKNTAIKLTNIYRGFSHFPQPYKYIPWFSAHPSALLIYTVVFHTAISVINIYRGFPHIHQSSHGIFK